MIIILVITYKSNRIINNYVGFQNKTYNSYKTTIKNQKYYLSPSMNVNNEINLTIHKILLFKIFNFKNQNIIIIVM